MNKRKTWPPLRKHEELSFDNSYASLPEAFYTKLNPTPFAASPYLVSFNLAVTELIDLDSEQAKRCDAWPGDSGDAGTVSCRKRP